MTRSFMPATLLAAALFAVAGCKKDSVPPADTPAAMPITAHLNMDWMFTAGGEPFALDATVLHDSLGIAVKLDTLRFFASGVHVLNDSHSAIGHFEGVYQLLDPAQASNALLVGSFTTTDREVHSLTFHIGLDPVANGGNPDTAAAPLNDHSMHFTGAWSGMGYKFLVVAGHADLDGDGAYETAVHFESGMNAALTPVEVHVDHDLADGEVFSPVLHVDLSALFQGLNLAATPTGDMHSDPAMRLIHNLAGSIAAM